MGSLISGILGGGQSDAQAGQTEALAAARDAAQGYRPEAMQARLNLLGKASNAYQGMNNALETMYGGRSPKVAGGMSQPPAPGGGSFGGNPVPQGWDPSMQGVPRDQQAQGGHGRPNYVSMFLDPANIFGGR